MAREEGVPGPRTATPGGGPHPNPAHAPLLRPPQLIPSPGSCSCWATGEVWEVFSFFSACVVRLESSTAFRKHSHIRQKTFTRESLGDILDFELNLPAGRGTEESIWPFL